MPGTVQIALCIILSHYSIQCDSVRGTIIPFYQRGSWGPPRISESHKGTLHSWSESEIWFKVRSTQLQSLDFSHWTYASYLASHLFLLGLLYCWKSSYLFKKTIHSTSARTMLSISFEHAWHRTGSWVDAQKIFIECMTALKKKSFVKAKNHQHWSTWNKQTVDKIVQVMTCTWIPSLFKKCFLASLITLDSSDQGLGLKSNSPQL